MSVAHEEYDDLHRLVDRLTPDQARQVHAVVLKLVQNEPETAAPRAGAPHRRFSFAGIISDEPDTARRSEEIIRDGFRSDPC
ncbi:hypothetical protein C1I98_09000 [Spongiactinospora gelatinilytica]|uniref:Uncharacterized protein n=1 Tax=Spongiactinospora gelatinilytica TaxID=2666298 RepID=A0A2W2GUI4_9ACTN|nr:hypothetical protein [Spongiactinospora gelatinilytica]PZG51353.1 hypothetical protein C1I98_09000 [Spongiactinospora gelatinilytica]